MSADQLPFDENFLKDKLKNDPTLWETRRQLAHGLFDKQSYEEAADIIWAADPIPSTDIDLAFAIRILAKARPRRAIRLLTAVLELNQGKAVQNMAMANALLHHGMVLQAARFYGAALEADPSLVNPDLEHFILWSDDECTLWGLFEKNRPKLGQLPWMLRDPKEALKLTSRISLHTTPISVPDLPVVAAEHLNHDLYQQEAKYLGKITPPPAVTIPIDRVDPKDRLFDADYGAAAPEVQAKPVAPAPMAPAEPTGFPASVVFPPAVRPAIPVAQVTSAGTTEIAAPDAPFVPDVHLGRTQSEQPMAGHGEASGSVQNDAPPKEQGFPSSVVLPSLVPSMAPTSPFAGDPLEIPASAFTAAETPSDGFVAAPPVVPAAPIPVAKPVPMAILMPNDKAEATPQILETQEGAPIAAPVPPVPSPADLPKGAPTGTPTRVLLPSGTPPAAGAPRRLLVTPPLNNPRAPHTQPATPPQNPKTTDAT